jgi:hypothetical protein
MPYAILETTMKKDEVRVGATYSTKISDKVVPVRITEERWTGDKLTGWIGLNTKTNRPVRIKSATKLRSEITSDHSEQSEPRSARYGARGEARQGEGECREEGRGAEAGEGEEGLGPRRRRPGAQGRG